MGDCPAVLKSDVLDIPCIGLQLNTGDLLRIAYVKPGDVAFVGGTLVQGIGNAYSDLDVYVVTDELRKAVDIDLGRHHRVLSLDRDILRKQDESAVYIIHTAIPNSCVKIDVEYVTNKYLEDLRRKVAGLFEYTTRNLVLLTKTLSVREQALIHRTMHGLPITDAGEAAAILATFSKEEYGYIAYRWLASDVSILLDIIGAAQAGEWDRAVDISRENVTRQITAFMHLKGLTETVQRKWVLKYASNDRLLPADLAQKFRNFFFLEGLSRGEFKAYVESSLDFIDEIFMRTKPLLETHARVPHGDMALQLLEADHATADHNTAMAELEYEYRRKPYGVLGRPSREYLQVSLSG